MGPKLQVLSPFYSDPCSCVCVRARVCTFVSSLYTFRFQITEKLKVHVIERQNKQFRFIQKYIVLIFFNKLLTFRKRLFKAGLRNIIKYMT